MLVLLLLVAATQLPPVSWTCPMHPEVVEDARGVCPICRMTLEPVRLDTVWSCPIHSVVASANPGRCPVCGRDLVRVTIAVSWACADRPDQPRIEPGRCADGTDAVVRYTPRPHGNHNPQHGGIFFMAPDNWHHLEGTYPEAGVFRLFLYDDYSKPLPADQVRRVTGILAIGGKDVRLSMGDDGRFLAARVPALKPPVEVTARLRFTTGGPETRFDFAFSDYSNDPAASTSRAPTALNDSPAAAAGQSTPAASAADATPAPSTAGPTRTSAATTLDDLVTALHARAERIQSAIDRRAYSEIWVPALEAKDVALSIADAAVASGTARFRIDSATEQLVRAAWLLDNVGDQGNAEQISDANARFKEALADLDRTLQSARRK